MTDRPLPRALFETLEKNAIRYGVFAGSEVAYLTGNRTPTDLDVLVHNDDLEKVAELFDAAVLSRQQSFPVTAGDGEQLTCIADTVTFRYGDFDVDMMANAAFVTADGAMYPTQLTVFAMAHRIRRDNVWLADPADTAVIKSFMRRGPEQNKFDQADVEVLRTQGLIDSRYLEQRLKEVGKHTPSVAFLESFALNSRQRHFLAAFFLSFMWGTFGVDRFYLGKIGTGALKLLSFGGFGVWTIIDLALIMSGTMRDKQGRELREAARYKRFAAHTVLWFAVVIGVLTLLGGIALIAAAYHIVTSLMQGGGVEQLLPTQQLPTGIDPSMML